MRLSLPLVIDQEIANLDEREMGACLFDVLDGGRVVFIGSTFWVLAVEALEFVEVAGDAILGGRSQPSALGIESLHLGVDGIGRRSEVLLASSEKESNHKNG